MPSTANNRTGYILISRKLIESEIWNKPPLYVKVWLYLLIRAQHSDYKDLKRGQLWTSIDEIREACSYNVGFRKVTPTKREVWSILEFLRNPKNGNILRKPYEGTAKETMVETTKGTHGMLVTICNYDVYQTPKNYEGNGEGNDEGTMKVTAREQYKQECNKECNKNVCVTRARAGEPSFEAQAVINYLNEATGRSFRASDPKTMALIENRLREGYQVSHFCTVIDNKVRQWLGDEKMEEFLTPRTLFSADHFADYLAQTPTKKEAGKQKKSPIDTLLGRIRRGDSPARLTEEEDRQIGLGLYNELCRKQSSMTDNEIRTAIAKGGID